MKLKDIICLLLKSENQKPIDAESTELINISNAEKHNLEAGVSHFADEVNFYNKIDNLYSLQGKIISDDYVVIASLMQLCHHNFIFCFINTLRSHFRESGAIVRTSIEAVGQAAKIKEDIKKNSRIWCEGENGKDKSGREEFEKLFKNDKFGSCKNKEQLKNYYRLLSTFGHPNIVSNIHRTKRTENKIHFGYFGTETENFGKWMKRYLNYTIIANLHILDEFYDIFDDGAIISKKQLEEVKIEHNNHLKSLLYLFNSPLGNHI